MESNGEFIDEVACITVQAIEDAFMECEEGESEEYEMQEAQLRAIAKDSFKLSGVGPQPFVIAVDEYQSVETRTYETLAAAVPPQ